MVGYLISRAKIKFLVLLVVMLLFWYLGTIFPVRQEVIQGRLKNFPLVYSGLIFIALYVVITFFLWLSKDVFKIAGAVLFGASVSSLFIWLAEILNAFILFNLARYLGRDFVAGSLKGRWQDLDKKLSGVNFFWLFIFRLTPLVPFRFMDLGLGLSRVSFKKYLMVVIFASPLRIFWVQYIISRVGGGIFGSPFALANYLTADKALFGFSLAYLVLVALAALKLKKYL